MKAKWETPTLEVLAINEETKSGSLPSLAEGVKAISTESSLTLGTGNASVG